MKIITSKAVYSNFVMMHTGNHSLFAPYLGNKIFGGTVKKKNAK